jgi:hypothetical protein
LDGCRPGELQSRHVDEAGRSRGARGLAAAAAAPGGEQHWRHQHRVVGSGGGLCLETLAQEVFFWPGLNIPTTGERDATKFTWDHAQRLGIG